LNWLEFLFLSIFYFFLNPSSGLLHYEHFNASFPPKAHTGRQADRLARTHSHSTSGASFPFSHFPSASWTRARLGNNFSVAYLLIPSGLRSRR
jgi:hypothetical protein